MFKMKSMIGGCGCFVFLLTVVLCSFILGAKYGRTVKKEILEKTSSVMDSTKQRLDKVNRHFQKTKDAAESLCGDDLKPDSDKTEFSEKDSLDF